MNRYVKMRLMGESQRRDRDRRNDRPDMRDGYRAPEDRFRDRDGREHYDDGRYAPMSLAGDPMDRRGYPRADYMEPYSHRGYPTYVPPIYERQDWQTREGYRPMNKIGFSVGGEMEHIPHELGHEYHTSAGYDPMEEMSSRQGDGYNMIQRPRVMPVFNRQMAEEWTEGMENEDDTRGPHWTLEKIKQEVEQRGIKCDLYKFWAVINSIYSDDVTIAKKHNVNTMDYYIDRAVAWLKDKDAVHDKAAAYYTYVVKH